MRTQEAKGNSKHPNLMPDRRQRSLSRKQAKIVRKIQTRVEHRNAGHAFIQACRNVRRACGVLPAAEPTSRLLPASSPLRWQLRPMLYKVPGHSRRRHHTEASYRRTHGKGHCHESDLSIAIEKSTSLATEPQEFYHE
jgi:hypothetical protein